jgi:hypothetical protein
MTSQYQPGHAQYPGGQHPSYQAAPRLQQSPPEHPSGGSAGPVRAPQQYSPPRQPQYQARAVPPQGGREAHQGGERPEHGPQDRPH